MQMAADGVMPTVAIAGKQSNRNRLRGFSL
nr:MAG TPA: hypothetical protein [Caudoviricetes sp.]